MRAVLALATMLAASPVFAGTPAFAGTVASMPGERRVLLLFAPAAGDARLAAQRDLLAPASAGLRERDITVVTVAGARVDGADDAATTLRARYRVPAPAFAALLVGKDGHVADRRDRPVAAAMLFATIDAMPMRRDEMRARR